MDYEKFIRERISELCAAADISEYQLSHDLGHSHSYINGITRGKMLPAMHEFLAICERFEITPADFFNTAQKMPALASLTAQKLPDLDETDLKAISHIVGRMSNKE